MKTQNITVSVATLFLATIPAMAGTTIPSTAESGCLVTTSTGWDVRVASYGWLTSMDGDVSVRGITAPVDVKFSDIIDKIDFAFAGVVEVGRGDWSFASDLFYAKLGAENTLFRRKFDAQLEQFVGNFVVVRNVIHDGTTRLDLFGGARVNSMSIDLNVDRPILPDRNVSQSKSWVDPVIGVRAQRNLSDKFYVSGVADIGGFGIQSDLTWQAYLALGYRVSEKGALSIGYRGIGTDYTDGGFSYDVISHGLLLGFDYKF